MIPRLVALVLVGLVALSVIESVAPVRAEPAEQDEFAVEAFPHPYGAVEFTDSWGARRSGGRRHRGTDILSPRGTPVVAVAGGMIIEMDRGRLSGYSIKVEHDGGWVSAYLHLNNDSPGTDDGEGGEQSAFAAGLTEGSLVTAGQLIGWVGDSGNAERTTPHTHFELSHHGVKINPYRHLVAAWRATGGSTPWSAG